MADESSFGNMTQALDAVNAVFVPSTPVSDKELLAGRTDQLFRLIEMTRTPGAHAAIYGERGVGKTSVATVFQLIIENDYFVTRMNCSADDDFASLWLSMADFIKDKALESGKFTEQEVETAKETLTYSQGTNDVARFLKKLTDKHPIVLLFDEFDVVGESRISEQFANLMKALSDLQVRAHLVVIGVAEDIDALLEGHASVARGLQQIKMPRLSDEELKDIIVRGSRILSIEFDEKITEKIVSLSQGLPHYTHLLAQQAATTAVLTRTKNIGMNFWKSALTSTLQRAQQQIVDLFQTATVSAKKTMFGDILIACALAPKDRQGFFRPTDLVEPLSLVLGRQVGIPGFIKSLALLADEERGPALESRVFADKRPRYRFANPLLQPYVLITAEEQEKISL
ncbi:ATP-binding protein [Streptomyces violaceus]|uniref:ATP-binding protein n=1 Tax=Streptomyces violaceus TaxID=1936 RepID=UPI002E2B98B1|nr:ATP-binding protein [Streptomyces violaceus]